MTCKKCNGKGMYAVTFWESVPGWRNGFPCSQLVLCSECDGPVRPGPLESYHKPSPELTEALNARPRHRQTKEEQ